MTRKFEHRTVPVGDIRLTNDSKPSFEAVALRYNVVDDYQTTFAPGAFTESLERRLPRIVWAHDWTEPLGRYVDYVDTDEELRLVGEFDDFDDVPQARRAHAQLRSGTIDQFSIGFFREADEKDPNHQGVNGFVTRITKASLDEVSLVLVGSVPGTQLVGVRHRDVEAPTALATRREMVVDKDASARILTRLGAGDIDLTDALVELRAIEQPAPLGGSGSFSTLPADRIAARAHSGSLDREVDDALAVVARKRDLDDEVSDALEIVNRHRR
ncbi:MAG: HK97 family phage prohead protease [Acidimicrobiales bacterium]